MYLCSEKKMKYIREVSDIHLDWDIDAFHGTRLYDPSKPAIREPMDMCWFPPSMDDDMETTFVIAGDIWTDGRFANRQWQDGSHDTWIARMSRRFKYIVCVLGNHDYWDRNVLYEAQKIKESIKAQGLTNVFLLERDAVVLDQVKFIGGTLWTDFNRHDPMVMHMAPSIMNDYKYMRYGRDYRRCRPSDLYEIHMNTKSFIFENAKRDYPEQKVAVVTHMAPSYQSVSHNYRQPWHATMNYLYYTDLEKRIMADGQDIDYWFHGHMHHSDSYYIGNVNVIINARGCSSENSLFDSEMQIPV